MKSKRIFILFILLFVLVHVHGQTSSSPYPAGAWSAPFSYSYTTNNMSGYPGYFFFLKFTINTPLDIDVTISGTNSENTRFALGTSPNNGPSNSGKATYSNLSSGTYIVSLDGYGFEGPFTIILQGKTPIPPSPISELSPSKGQNYIATIRPLTELTNVGHMGLDNTIYSFRYYDGLGRPAQEVNANAGLSGQDLVSLQQYDNFGRESNAWLPAATSGDRGAFITTGTLPGLAAATYAGDTRPYTQTVYEASPLNRITKQYSPGSAWNARPVSTDYLSNSTVTPLNCIKFSVGSSTTLINGGNYAANLLAVVKTTDEDLNVSYTFTDKLNRTVLTRQMKGSDTHDTYYVYDDKGNLCFVLQPMYQSSANLDLYAFQYKYDDRNRCIWKKLPGSQYAEYTYDTADRLTFSQDGRQRASGKWTFYEYDQFDRLMRQGECANKTVSSNTVVNIQNYYDNYDFLTLAGFTNRTYFPAASISGKGVLTGSAISVLGSSNKIYTANYYDVKGRVTKSVSNNLLGGYETISTVYTFTDNPVTVAHTHTASGKPSLSEVYKYTYDYADRVSKVEHTLNGVKVTLADNTYDNVGRLQAKSLHGSATNKLTYAYNIRNWLTGITATRFTQNLFYNTGYGTACYNGNISSMTWKGGSESTVRGYKFSYDGLNRLTNAVYGETSSINTNLDNFTEKVIGYDKNGNITALQRRGQTATSIFNLIDNLTYSLTGNQVSRVDDAVTTSAYNNGFEFKNGANAAGEYTYDANGNLTKDLNKGISSIQYNILNLPSGITFSDGSINYLYSADGTKLRTIHKTGSTTTTTDYCDNVIYENGTTKLLLIEEGYVSLSDSKYHYYLKDHQGNNRVVINQTGSVEETNHYYPFGGVFASTGNVQPYKYNGKELDTKKGLNWYDYGARHYDAALGRFTTNDPSSESYYTSSPYAYCGSNPINRIDPTGADWYEDEKGNLRWIEGSLDVDGYHRLGASVSIRFGENSYFNAYQNAGILANQAVNAFDLIASSDKLQNQFLGKDSPLSEASKSALFNSLNSRSMDAIARPIGEAIFNLGAGELGGALVGKAIGWAVGKFAGRASSALRPLGIGNTGRTIAQNLTEQMTMQEALSNPLAGDLIKRMAPINDTRWLGWRKMQYIHTGLDGSKTVIHYVGKWEKGILKAVDDFKFK